jgi:hypothetical protein
MALLQGACAEFDSLSEYMSNPTMLPKEQFEKMSKEELEEQIKVRRELLGQMVGWLYTSVLNDEIEELQKRRQTLR